jgi:hypothetical protein
MAARRRIQSSGDGSDYAAHRRVLGTAGVGRVPLKKTQHGTKFLNSVLFTLITSQEGPIYQVRT